jgi:hypothetical protein
MRSFDGIGGEFDDIEFCDTSVTDPATGDAATTYSWWQPFADGKRFYVPDVARLNNKFIVFNVKELTEIGKQLLEEHPALYPGAANFGRKSFEKIVTNRAMTYPKAVLATRTVNAYLERYKIKGNNGTIARIEKGRILMSGYRVESLTKSLRYYSQKFSKQTDAKTATEYLAREADVSEFIIEELYRDDEMFVVAPTALAIIDALIHNHQMFGILPAAKSKLLKLGPSPGQHMRFSVLETGDSKESNDRSDPKFVSRTAQSPNPNNPYRSTT